MNTSYLFIPPKCYRSLAIKSLNLKNSFCIFDSIYLCTPCACLVPMEKRGGHWYWVPWKWNYKQSSAFIRLLETKPRSSSKASGALSFYVNSSALRLWLYLSQLNNFTINKTLWCFGIEWNFFKCIHSVFYQNKLFSISLFKYYNYAK